MRGNIFEVRRVFCIGIVCVCFGVVGVGGWRSWVGWMGGCGDRDLFHQGLGFCVAE